MTTDQRRLNRRLSDDEGLQLRAAFYKLAEATVDAFQSERAAFANVERDDLYEVEERAAILEFDAGGNRNRATAEAVAVYEARKHRRTEDE